MKKNGYMDFIITIFWDLTMWFDEDRPCSHTWWWHLKCINFALGPMMSPGQIKFSSAFFHCLSQADGEGEKAGKSALSFCHSNREQLFVYLKGQGTSALLLCSPAESRTPVVSTTGWDSRSLSKVDIKLIIWGIKETTSGLLRKQRGKTDQYPPWKPHKIVAWRTYKPM